MYEMLHEKIFRILYIYIYIYHFCIQYFDVSETPL